MAVPTLHLFRRGIVAASLSIQQLVVPKRPSRLNEERAPRPDDSENFLLN